MPEDLRLTDDDLCPVFYDYKLKRNVRYSDSVKETPSIGLALLDGMCLERDVRDLPKSRNGLITHLAAQIALTNQAAACCFGKIADNDQARLVSDEHIKKEHEKALGALRQNLALAKEAYEAESREKAIAEANCAEALRRVEEVQKAFDDYKSVEQKRKEAWQTVARDATIAGLQEQVEKLEDQWRGEAMTQGFELGYRRALGAAGVPSDSPLWVLPPVPAYEYPSEEAAADVPTQGGGGSTAPSDPNIGSAAP